MATMAAISASAQDGNNPTQGQAMTETIDEGTKYPGIIALDSIYNAPVLISWFDKPVAINLENHNKLVIDLAEITDLYSGDKNYRLHFDISFRSTNSADREIKTFVSYEKGVSMVNALKGIHKYIAEQLPSTPENIRYSIDLSTDIMFEMNLSYNYTKYNWECYIEFSTQNSIKTYSDNFRISPSNGFVLYGYLKNTSTDLPRLINYIEQRLLTLKTRMEQDAQNERLLFSYNDDGSVTCSYNDERQPTGEMLWGIENIFDINGYSKKISKKFTKILTNELSNITDISTIGIANIIIDKNGEILGKKITFPKETFHRLNKRIIMLLLNCINEEPTIQFRDRNVGLGCDQANANVILKITK